MAWTCAKDRARADPRKMDKEKKTWPRTVVKDLEQMTRPWGAAQHAAKGQKGWRERAHWSLV